MKLSVNKVGQYIARPKNPMKSAVNEFGKQYLISIPSTAAHVVLGGTIGFPLMVLTATINLVRTLNRWGRGLYFKFEESIGQEGLSKLSQINFSKLGKVNLNKLAKGKIKATNSEAVKFQKVAQEILKSKKKANFNILKRVEIFKLEK